MIMLLYSLALTIGLAAWTLRYIVPMAISRRYPPGLAERFGRVPEGLEQSLAGRRVVWVHAVSVGEVLAASRLVEELGAALGDGWVVCVSTTTETGQELARKRFGAERVFYMPLDFAFAVRPYLKVLKPAALVLMESEVWPRMVHECRRMGTAVIVVNARVSDRSFGRSLKVRWIWSRVLRRATLWLTQSEEDARRLVAMGARAEDVRVGGNLKYDVRAPKESRVAGLIKEAAGGRPIIVAGSTVDDQKGVRGGWEETEVIHAWESGVRGQFAALLVIAPRHPERFDLIHSVVAEYCYALASDWVSAEDGTPPFAKNAKDGPPGSAGGEYNFVPGHRGRLDVVLLDTIGDLAAVYGVADVAFVGGSLVKKGGHNPLEPAQFGVPVVMGTSYENFRGVVEAMSAADGIWILGRGDTGLFTALRSGRDNGVEGEEELEAAFVELLTNRDAAREMGERGRKVFEAQQGATVRSVEAIVAMVKR